MLCEVLDIVIIPFRIKFLKLHAGKVPHGILRRKFFMLWLWPKQGKNAATPNLPSPVHNWFTEKLDTKNSAKALTSAPRPFSLDVVDRAASQ